MNVALLQADYVDDDLRTIAGDLPDIFCSMFNSFPDVSIDAYNVTLNKFPSSKNSYDAFIISGSRHNIFDDYNWIRHLHSFVKSSIISKRKIIGFCFGHQLIANAMGGLVQLNNNWNLGVQELTILQKKIWMEPFVCKLNLLFNHKYGVVSLPKNAEIFAQTDSFIQMYAIENYFLGLQAHPEYSVRFQEKLMEKTFQNDNNPLVVSAKIRNQTDIDFSVKTINQWIYNFIAH
jgi:GMP synthase-like glutamine amidotransferase